MAGEELGTCPTRPPGAFYLNKQLPWVWETLGWWKAGGKTLSGHYKQIGVRKRATIIFPLPGPHI